MGAGPAAGGCRPPVGPAKCSMPPPPRLPPSRAEARERSGDLALHVEEEGGGAAALQQALALLGDFPGLFTVLAADGERERAKTLLGDFLAALEAVAEGAFIQPPERFLDLGERFGLHLDQREL